MKIILCFSLIANIVLVALAMHKSSNSAPQPLTTVAEIPNSEVWTHGGAAPNRPKAKARTAPWRSVESSDPAEFMANLRAAGCPDQTVRDIVTFRICRQFRNQLLAAESESLRQWDPTRSRSQKDWDESRARNQDLRDQMIDTLESTLGQSWSSIQNSIENLPVTDWLGPLSLETRRQIREVEKRYRSQIDKLQREIMMDREQNPETQDQLRQLQKAKEAELAATLSPQEYEEYFYRNSIAADYVRQQGPDALSESDFRIMVRLANEMDMRPPPTLTAPSIDSSYINNPAVREMEERKAAFDRRLKEALGEQRIAEQKAAEQARQQEEDELNRNRGQQEMRDRIAGLAADVGVSAQDANRFWDRMQELGPTLQPKMQELEKSLTGTPEEQHEQMKAAVAAEFEKVATDMLGPKGKELVKKMVEELH